MNTAACDPPPSAGGGHRSDPATRRSRSAAPWRLDSDHPHNWRLETEHRPLWCGEKDTAGSLLDLAMRMLAVPYAGADPAVEIAAVEQPIAVPLVNQETGEVLDRDLVGSVDLVERDGEGHLVVVDLKTSARRYTDLQVDLSLQLCVYSYATTMNGRFETTSVER